MARDVGYLFGRLHGAPEIAAVEHRKTLACQALRQCFGLENSLFGQLAIEVPLANPASIPFGLAMPNNDHLRALHECLPPMVRGKKSTLLLRKNEAYGRSMRPFVCSRRSVQGARRNLFARIRRRGAQLQQIELIS